MAIALAADRLLVLPSLLVWGFAGAEFALQFRHWSAPVRLTVGGGAFSFPYPTFRSRPEDLRADLVARVDVVQVRSRVLRRRRWALEVGLEHGPTFALLAGYPHRTLEEVGVAFGITRERTRQIEAEALRRLRDERLHAYLD